MTKKHGNLSIFIPHAGCPQQCSFCNQRSIANTEAPPTPEEVRNICDTFLPHNIVADKEIEIAFFGGSFTAIDRAYMMNLLKAAYPFVQAKRAVGIRISTRPDAIDYEVLNILKCYGVTSIELGAQSMLNEVLTKNERGHTAEDVINAATLIKAHGFSLGLQMMVGLPFEQDAKIAAMKTTKQLASLKPSTMRIYPAITLTGTQMESWYNKGDYIPLTLDEAVDICADLLTFFEKENIRVIRVGLHADEGLKAGYVAGPYHEAFRQLCTSKQYQNKLMQTLAVKPLGKYTIYIAKGEYSNVAGHKNTNKLFFENKGYILHIEETDAIQKGQFRLTPKEQ